MGPEQHGQARRNIHKEQRRLWMIAGTSQDQVMALLRPCNDDMYTLTETNRKPIKPSRPKNNRLADS